MSNELSSFHEELLQDIVARADAGGAFLPDAFFEVFTGYLISAGELDTADRAHYQGARGVRVDGYAGDPLENDNVLTLIVQEFRQERDVSTLTATALEKLFKRAANFVEKSLETSFRNSLEESSPAYGLADLISARWKRLNKIRLLVITNQVLSSRVDSFPAGQIEGVQTTHSVWDLGRLQRVVVSGRGHEDIQIDVEGEFGGAIPALPAHLATADYEAYLLVVPGRQLAAIYDRWGTRLLEQNVRVFLQARGNVNKGIKTTLEKDPGMFFAYNNGVTATAEAVELKEVDGRLLLAGMSNFQIVNGGQTTASIHAAMTRNVDLAEVFVQMKLSIIDPDRSDEVVPRISEFANSQNRVNAADFFSNHPFHIRMEQFSRRVYAPSVDGTFKQSKWFYERARGQYADARARLTVAKRREFDVEYPRKQVFSKTDLAKFLMVWEGKPDVVSKGAQKNFAAFAPEVARKWDSDDTAFSEDYYRTLIAKAIVFKQMETLVQEQPWYSGGYRANVVAYGIAKLAFDLGRQGKAVDFAAIWARQEISDPLRSALIVAAEAAHEVLTNPPPGFKNVTEWAKQQACRDRMQRAAVAWPDSLDEMTLGYEQVREAERDGRRDQKMLNGIQAQMAVVRAGADFWSEVLAWGAARRRLSPRESSILGICAAIPSKTPSEAQSEVALQALRRLQAEGLDLELAS